MVRSNATLTLLALAVLVLAPVAAAHGPPELLCDGRPNLSGEPCTEQSPSTPHGSAVEDAYDLLP